MNCNQKIVDHIRSIPPLSQSATRIMKIMRQAYYNLTDISHIVEYDAALTTNVLKVVNTPAFGLGTPVHSVVRAVSFLGDKAVAGIALASCSPYVYDRPLSGYEAKRGELWEHSLFAAIAARELALKAKTAISAETAYTGALVHDIGKAVLSLFYEGRVREMLLSMDSCEAADFAAMEREVFGFDHAEVGQALARHWNLPLELVHCIRYHHDPGNAPARHAPLVFAVHLADMLSMLSGAGTGADSLQYTLDPAWEKHFDLSQEDIESTMLDTVMEFERLRSLFCSN